MRAGGSSSAASSATPCSVIAVLLVLFPIYWMIITSLKLPREIYRVPSLWPKVFTLDNYQSCSATATSCSPSATA